MTKYFSFGWILCLLAAVSLAGAVSCQREDYLPEDKIGVLKSVRLSLSVGSSSQTKMVVDENHLAELGDSPLFRGLEDMKMVAFRGNGTVVDSSKTLNLPISVPAFNALNYPKVSAYFYPSGIDTFIPIGTSSVLLYGRAPGDEKASYGSLIPKGFDTQNTKALASSFGFEPDVMYPDSIIPDQATVIARVVNTIMQGAPVRIDGRYQRGTESVNKQVVVNWNENVEDVNLSKAYKDITNEGAIIPGSGPMVESMLSSLYSFFKGYESVSETIYEVTENGEHYPVLKEDGDTLLYKDIFNKLRLEVLSRFTSEKAYASSFITVSDKDSVSFKLENLSTYPESMGLPTGCAILRWTPAGFVVPKFSGVEGMAPLNRYCYPAGLYYYVCTDIKTSQDKDIADSYDKEGYTTWKQVTDDYNLGSEVTSNTTSVALVKPIQYAVGMLSATVKSDRDWLQDNDGLPQTTVSATGKNLPVTGIILSGQYAQNFDFTPDTDAVKAGDEYFSYDHKTPGVYLTKEQSAPIRTLSLPTPEGKDIYFTLEFLNNSGETFYGADGRVLPGRKFYMVGKMEFPKKQEDRKFEQIFVKDHITKLDCTIKSLAGAYNAVPDLGIPQLVIGVQTRVNWEMSSPTTIMFE